MDRVVVSIFIKLYHAVVRALNYKRNGKWNKVKSKIGLGDERTSKMWVVIYGFGFDQFSYSSICVSQVVYYFDEKQSNEYVFPH